MSNPMIVILVIFAILVGVLLLLNNWLSSERRDTRCRDGLKDNAEDLEQNGRDQITHQPKSANIQKPESLQVILNTNIEEAKAKAEEHFNEIETDAWRMQEMMKPIRKGFEELHELLPKDRPTFDDVWLGHKETVDFFGDSEEIFEGYVYKSISGFPLRGTIKPDLVAGQYFCEYEIFYEHDDHVDEKVRFDTPEEVMQLVTAQFGRIIGEQLVADKELERQVIEEEDMEDYEDEQLDDVSEPD